MKKAAILLMLLATFRARADLVITYAVDTDGKAGKLIQKFHGDKLLIDQDGKTSTIIDLNTGDMVVLDIHYKSYTKLPAQNMKAADATPQTEIKMADTAVDEEVNGCKSRIYKAESADTKFTFWITPDMPHWVDIQLLMKKLRSVSGGGGPWPDITTLDGLPVKSVSVTSLKTPSGEIRTMTTTVTFISVKDDEVPDSEFEIPVAYTESNNQGYRAMPRGLTKRQYERLENVPNVP